MLPVEIRPRDGRGVSSAPVSAVRLPLDNTGRRQASGPSLPLSAGSNLPVDGS